MPNKVVAMVQLKIVISTVLSIVKESRGSSYYGQIPQILQGKGSG